MHLLADDILSGLLDPEAEGDVFVYVQMGKEGVALKHRVDFPAVGRYVVDALPVENHGALILFQETAQDPQQRRFSAAGRTQQRDKLILINIQVHALQHDLAVEALDNVLELNQFAHRCSLLLIDDGSFRSRVTVTGYDAGVGAGVGTSGGTAVSRAGGASVSGASASEFSVSGVRPVSHIRSISFWSALPLGYRP